MYWGGIQATFKNNYLGNQSCLEPYAYSFKHSKIKHKFHVKKNINHTSQTATNLNILAYQSKSLSVCHCKWELLIKNANCCIFFESESILGVSTSEKISEHCCIFFESDFILGWSKSKVSSLCKILTKKKE